MSGEPPRGAAALSAVIAGVWARCSGAVLARVDVLDGAARALLEGRLTREERRAAEREAHKLAGSVGTFGFAEATRLSREAEVLLGGPEPTRTDALRLAELAAAIRSELAVPPAGGPAPAPEGPAGTEG